MGDGGVTVILGGISTDDAALFNDGDEESTKDLEGGEFQGMTFGGGAKAASMKVDGFGTDGGKFPMADSIGLAFSGVTEQFEFEEPTSAVPEVEIDFEEADAGLLPE